LPDQTFFDIVKMVVALACVIGLIFGVVLVLKRLMPASARAGGERIGLQVLAQLSVGPRQRISVVRVQGRTLVLGITEGSINTLAELSEQRAEAVKEADDPKIFTDLLAWRKDAPAPLQHRSEGSAAADDFGLVPMGRRSDGTADAASQRSADRGDGPPLFAPGERPAR
jgi:flagellar protein FliO/FliZ